MYDRPHLGAFAYSFHGDALTYSPPNKSAVHFDGYAETMRLEGICNGRATYIDVISYLCSNDSMAAYDIWYALHMYSFQGMAASLGATVMAGDCPREGFKLSSRMFLTGYLAKKSYCVKNNGKE
jgi:hypothetical protein